MQLSKGTNDPQYTRKINAPEYTVNIYLDDSGSYIDGWQAGTYSRL